MAEELHRAAALPSVQPGRQSLELHGEVHAEQPLCFWFIGGVVERVMAPS